ncbi:MAG: HisA/HisF-related TIM barrel protein [Bryobacteraceae bacterium]
MIVPCIDLMGGKVVQLIQGRDKALEIDDPFEMLQAFSAFPEIQVIDLDAAKGTSSNDELVDLLASRARCRIGGGVRSADRARRLVERGAHKIIIGTAAFSQPILLDIVRAVGKDRLIVALDSKHGEIVIRGWTESTHLKAEDWLAYFEPYCSGFLCTYVDKEGMLQGTDLDWFRRLRAATGLELTAAGGITSLDEIKELDRVGVHAAVGMAIYTGWLNLDDLVHWYRSVH